MKKNAFLWIWIPIVLVLVLGATVGCVEQNPITVALEGEAYRGAKLAVSATIDHNGVSVEDVSFAVVEGADFAYISDDKLCIQENAPIGKKVTVAVRWSTWEDRASVTVGNTPVAAVVWEEPDSKAAGESVALTAKPMPAYADDNPVVYSIVEGSEYATLADGCLVWNKDADKANGVVVRATAGGVSADKTLYCTSVQPQEVQVGIATNVVLRRGEELALSATVLPAECTYPLVWTVEGDLAPWIRIEENRLVVAEDCPEGVFELVWSVGDLDDRLSVAVGKTAVERVVLSRNDTTQTELAHTAVYGELITLTARVYPAYATYPAVQLAVVEGADCVEKVSEWQYRVVSREGGKTVVFEATADGVKATFSVVIKAVAPESVSLTADGSASVRIGDVRTLSAVVLPTDAVADVQFAILQGAEYATLVDNILTFVGASEALTTEVVVEVSAGECRDTLRFYVVRVPVESVSLTADAVGPLVAGQVVTLSAAVLPTDATASGVEYRIVEGSHLGSLVDNLFTVGEGVYAGTVSFVAVSEDGVESNVLQLEVSGQAVTLSPSSWSAVDGLSSYMSGHASVYLDLTLLPALAGETVVVVSDDVEQLWIKGRYDGTEDSDYHNLYFFFLTTDEIEVTLENVGIVIDSGFTDPVLDFGTRASVRLEVVGTNSITAGSAYQLATDGYTIVGAYDADNSARIDGQDGFSGMDGGIAVRAHALTLLGEGDLLLVGGNASSGTNGTAGGDAPTAEIKAGNGGRGGAGGMGGYALWVDTLTYDFGGTVGLTAGAAGLGGLGGAGGVGLGADMNGEKGADGSNGSALAAVRAEQINTVRGVPTVTTGVPMVGLGVRDFGSADAGIALLAKHYKLSIVYRDIDNPYADKLLASQRFLMEEQTVEANLLVQLQGLAFALQVTSRNTLLETTAAVVNGVRVLNRKPLTVYLVDEITTGSGGIVYGLTNDNNQVWLACFTPRPRNTFYSTHYNIMLHELLHVLTFNLPSDVVSELKSGIKSYNLGLSYVSNSSGVYNPKGGNNGTNSAFLTLYSKNDYREDISDNLSLMAMLVGPRDFTAADAPLAKKATYITGVLDAYYTMPAVVAWLRYVG